MGKTGGIIGIIAGVFGFIAAIVTLLLGGLGSAFKADGAQTIVGLGWGGVLFSFLAIVFGAVAIAKPKGAGIGLIIVSILGAIMGGMLVAICMALSLIGGILAVVGAQKATPAVLSATAAIDAIPAKKGKWGWLLAGVAVAVIAVVGFIAGQAPSKPKEDPLAALINTSPSALRPEGELSAMFSFGSKNTDLQRENKLKEITGQVVQWKLPVYEVSRSGDTYKVQTKSDIGIGMFSQNLVGTFIYLTPRDETEQKTIEALKTGDIISFKGIISGSSLRSLELKPAILATEEPHAQEQAAAQEQTSPVTQPPSVAAPVAAPADTPTAEPVTPAQQPTATNPPPAPVNRPSEIDILSKYKVSFNCNKASTTAERLTCSNAVLGQLDGLLTYTFKDRMNNPAFGVNQAAFKAEQQAWLKSKDTCSDEACLEKSYRQRISDLCEMPVASGNHPSGDCDMINVVSSSDDAISNEEIQKKIDNEESRQKGLVNCPKNNQFIGRDGELHCDR